MGELCRGHWPTDLIVVTRFREDSMSRKSLSRKSQVAEKGLAGECEAMGMPKPLQSLSYHRKESALDNALTWSMND